MNCSFHRKVKQDREECGEDVYSAKGNNNNNKMLKIPLPSVRGGAKRMCLSTKTEEREMGSGGEVGEGEKIKDEVKWWRLDPSTASVSLAGGERDPRKIFFFPL